MNSKLNMSYIYRIVICLTLFIYINSVYALQIGYSLSGGAEYSDNITRSSNNIISGTTRRLGLSADIEHQAEKISYNFAPRIEYYNYTPEELENRTLYYLDSSLLWNIVDSRFSWSVDDYIDQTSTDVTSPDTPFNSQTTNVFITGPDLQLLLGNGRRLEFFIRYADFYYEVSDDYDSQRYGGLLRLTSQPTSLFSYSINLDATNVAYKQEIFNQNYNRYDVFVGTNRIGNLYDLKFNVGYSIIQREISEDLLGMLLNFNLEVRPGSRSRIIMLGRSEYTDSSRNFLTSRFITEDVRRYNTAISSEIFQENYLFGIYEWNDGITRIGAEAAISDQVYEEETVTELDRLIKEAGIHVRRRITSLAEVFLRARWRNTYYRQTTRDDADELYTIGLRYRLSRSLYINADYEYAARDSNFINANYTENSAFLNVEFRR